MAKKIKHSAEEITNDPSLQYFEYRYGEVVWSDTHNCEMRFSAYEGDCVRLLTVAAMAPVEGLFARLSVRRPSCQPGYCIEGPGAAVRNAIVVEHRMKVAKRSEKNKSRKKPRQS